MVIVNKSDGDVLYALDINTMDDAIDVNIAKLAGTTASDYLDTSNAVEAKNKLNALLNSEYSGWDAELHGIGTPNYYNFVFDIFGSNAKTDTANSSDVMRVNASGGYYSLDIKDFTDTADEIADFTGASMDPDWSLGVDGVNATCTFDAANDEVDMYVGSQSKAFIWYDVSTKVWAGIHVAFRNIAYGVPWINDHRCFIYLSSQEPNGTDINSTHGYLYYNPRDGNLYGSMITTTAIGADKTTLYLRLRKNGDGWLVYWSNNGSDWNQVGSTPTLGAGAHDDTSLFWICLGVGTVNLVANSYTSASVFQANLWYNYETSGTLQSTALATGTTYTNALLTCIGENKPANTNITYTLSANGGTNWESVTADTLKRFANTGTSLKVKASFTTSDITASSKIYDYGIVYNLY